MLRVVQNVEQKALLRPKSYLLETAELPWRAHTRQKIRKIIQNKKLPIWQGYNRKICTVNTLIDPRIQQKHKLKEVLWRTDKNSTVLWS